MVLQLTSLTTFLSMVETPLDMLEVARRWMKSGGDMDMVVAVSFGVLGEVFEFEFVEWWNVDKGYGSF